MRSDFFVNGCSTKKIFMYVYKDLFDNGYDYIPVKVILGKWEFDKNWWHISSWILVVFL